MLVNEVRKRRIRKGLTQKELAKMVGIGLSQMINIENKNHEPKLHTMKKLADALGVKVSQLFYQK